MFFQAHDTRELQDPTKTLMFWNQGLGPLNFWLMSYLRVLGSVKIVNKRRLDRQNSSEYSELRQRTDYFYLFLTFEDALGLVWWDQKELRHTGQDGWLSTQMDTRRKIREQEAI